jgi:hypothetical protein
MGGSSATSEVGTRIGLRQRQVSHVSSAFSEGIVIIHDCIKNYSLSGLARQDKDKPGKGPEKEYPAFRTAGERKGEHAMRT